MTTIPRTKSGSADETAPRWDWEAEVAARAPGPEAIPHVVAWNLTRRCNLECAHCYIAAGSWHSSEDEMPTADCLRVVDEILAVSPAPMLILSGGEPLLRGDLETIASRAARGGATVVVGTNGTRLTSARIRSLKAAGVRGVAVSVDSLDPTYHDRFRHGEGSLGETLEAIERLREEELDFVVQTTVTRGNIDEIPRLVSWSAEKGAVSFNCYFIVPTGRGEGMRGLPPEENDRVLAELVRLGREYRGRMMVRSKCQPQIMRHAYETDPESGLLDYSTRCPCGVQYCRITPEGKVTPCPYMPVEAGDLSVESFGEIWRGSPVFRDLRFGDLGGRCGRCEYRAVCGGCRARAFAESGDWLAEDPACAYQPTGDEPLVLPRPVTYGSPVEPSLPWSAAAEERMRRVPGFVRAVVTARVESYAAERGYALVTEDVIDEVRSALPIDFGKRRPFFLGKDRP
ncbi:MAG TPA: radical SAM protein [Gemmatimonadota bacterium]|nr:radical SAM protein [Gemmatimonadota bacterium]